MHSHPDVSSFKDSQTLIVQNLTQIDTLASPSPLPPDNLPELRRLFQETVLWIDSHVSSLEADIVFQLLEFLSHYYQAT